jgi:hypothetical protein
MRNGYTTSNIHGLEDFCKLVPVVFELAVFFFLQTQLDFLEADFFVNDFLDADILEADALEARIFWPDNLDPDLYEDAMVLDCADDEALDFEPDLRFLDFDESHLHSALGLVGFFFLQTQLDFLEAGFFVNDSLDADILEARIFWPDNLDPDLYEAAMVLDCLDDEALDFEPDLRFLDFDESHLHSALGLVVFFKSFDVDC